MHIRCPSSSWCRRAWTSHGRTWSANTGTSKKTRRRSGWRWRRLDVGLTHGGHHAHRFGWSCCWRIVETEVKVVFVFFLAEAEQSSSLIASRAASVEAASHSHTVEHIALSITVGSRWRYYTSQCFKTSRAFGSWCHWCYATRISFLSTIATTKFNRHPRLLERGRIFFIGIDESASERLAE